MFTAIANTDWKRLAQGIRGKVVEYSKKAGRAGARVILKFYYTMLYGDLSSSEKAMVYAGIIYILFPRDLLPRKILGWLGFLDDIGVAAWIIERIGKSITPEIEQKVENTLDDWFGPVVTIGYPD